MKRHLLALSTALAIVATVASLAPLRAQGPAALTKTSTPATTSWAGSGSGYNANVQIVQTPTHVVLLNEMIHNSRIIPLDGRPHLPPNVRQWAGDSRGRWEGNTLVVDTTNFRTDSVSDFRSGERPFGDKFHLVERFTRVDAGTLLYQFTIEDPTWFTRLWTAQIPMTKTEGLIYEYACHEGNHSIVNTLAGARAGDNTEGKRPKAKGSR